MVDSKLTAKDLDRSRRKQKRGVLTRQQLLRSARVIFARDGFEHARLEDIASQAGKTRGAFYANFKDKEDVFCAIFEDDLNQDMVTLGPLLMSLPRLEQRIEALSDFLAELGRNRERTLLNLEFKLYAIRHPRRRKRLATLHQMMLHRSPIPELNQFLKEVGGEGDIAGSLAICGIADGLALNHLFDPMALDRSELGRYLTLCLRETLHLIPVKASGVRVVPAKKKALTK